MSLRFFVGFFDAVSFMISLNGFPPWNIVFENGWLEDEISFWDGLFWNGDLLVSGRVFSVCSFYICKFRSEFCWKLSLPDRMDSTTSPSVKVSWLVAISNTARKKIKSTKGGRISSTFFNYDFVVFLCQFYTFLSFNCERHDHDIDRWFIANGTEAQVSFTDSVFLLCFGHTFIGKTMIKIRKSLQLHVPNESRGRYPKVWYFGLTQRILAEQECDKIIRSCHLK